MVLLGQVSARPFETGELWNKRRIRRLNYNAMVRALQRRSLYRCFFGLKRHFLAVAGAAASYAYGNPYRYGYQSYSYGSPSSYGYAPYGTGYYGYAPSSYNYG